MSKGSEATLRWRAKNRKVYDRYTYNDQAGKNSLVAIFKLESGCVDCGYDKDPQALDLDHVRGDKIAVVSRLVKTASLERIVDELDKCEVVCANCHRLRSVNRREWTMPDDI